jgi:hypothetical protein
MQIENNGKTIMNVQNRYPWTTVTAAILGIGLTLLPSKGLAASACCGHAAPATGAAKTETTKPAEVKLQPQSTCPIMGGAIDPSQYVDRDGKRIFVCCPPCKEKVSADLRLRSRNLQKPAKDRDKPCARSCGVWRLPPKAGMWTMRDNASMSAAVAAHALYKPIPKQH